MNGKQPPPLRRVLYLFFSLDRMRRCYRSRPILDPDSPGGFARKHNIDDVPDECGLRERDQHRRKRYLQTGFTKAKSLPFKLYRGSALMISSASLIWVWLNCRIVTGRTARVRSFGCLREP